MLSQERAKPARILVKTSQDFASCDCIRTSPLSGIKFSNTGGLISEGGFCGLSGRGFANNGEASGIVR